MFTRKPIAIVSVINDLVTDNRVQRICQTLLEEGFDVRLIGRESRQSPPLAPMPFSRERMGVLAEKGPLMYLLFNTQLFFRLLFSRAALLYANDLDTLLPNYLVSVLRRIPLVYDSHELFCEVPELAERPRKRAIWKWLESRIVPRLKNCITVNESIAGLYEKEYGVPFRVVRNIGTYPSGLPVRSRSELDLPEDRRIIIMQGAGINIDRGAEELLEAMQHVDNALLLVIGGGDVWPVLEKMVVTRNLGKKVRMIRRIPREDLMHFTANADLGLSIDKNTNLNYRFSLPNKLFDYLHAGIPVLASRMPEVENIIKTYNAGDFIMSHEPAHIAEKITQMLARGKQYYAEGLQRAAQELTWSAEKESLGQVIRSAMLNTVKTG